MLFLFRQPCFSLRHCFSLHQFFPCNFLVTLHHSAIKLRAQASQRNAPVSQSVPMQSVERSPHTQHILQNYAVPEAFPVHLNHIAYHLEGIEGYSDWCGKLKHGRSESNAKYSKRIRQYLPCKIKVLEHQKKPQRYCKGQPEAQLFKLPWHFSIKIAPRYVATHTIHRSMKFLTPNPR